MSERRAPMGNVESVDPVSFAVEQHERAIQLREAGDFGAAELACRDAVNLFAEHEGESSPDLANALVEHARLLEVLDRLPEAASAVERALTILRPLAQLEEPDDESIRPSPDVAVMPDGVDAEVLEELARLTLRGEMVRAWVARGRGRLDEAEKGYRRVIDLVKTRLGPDDRLMIDALNGLGVVHKFQGRYDEAEPLYRRAVAILEAHGDAEGEDAATLLHNLGGLAHSRGDFVAGEPLARRSVELREALLGRDHPATAADRAAWGALLEGLGQLDAAERAYAEALAVFEKRLGPDSLEVAATLTSLGAVEHSRGAFVEAETAYRRALAIREGKLGPMHADVAMTLNNLSILLAERGSPEALGLAARAQSIFQATLGPAHPHTRAAAENVEFLRGRHPGREESGA